MDRVAVFINDIKIWILYIPYSRHEKFLFRMSIVRMNQDYFLSFSKVDHLYNIEIGSCAF